MSPQTAIAEPKKGRPLPMHAPAKAPKRDDLPEGLAPPASAFVPRPTAEQNGVRVWGTGLPTTAAWKDEHEYTYLNNVRNAILMVGMALAFPLWPVFCSITTGDWSYTRRYFHTLFFMLKQAMPRVNNHASFMRMLKYNVMWRPATLRKQLETRQGSCTRCGKCCKSLGCIFLGWDEEHSVPFCRVYNTRAWYFGTCSRYPIDQADIDDHGCTGFSFPAEPEAESAEKASFAV